MAPERQESDPFLVCVVKRHTLLEKATIVITSRPHACEKLDGGRKVEVVEFGKDEIREFVEESFPNDAKCEDNKWWKDTKIIFTVADLKECDMEVTAEWDGYGFLKAMLTHRLPTDTITYNFSHLTIQEFLCAVYTYFNIITRRTATSTEKILW